MLFGSRSTPEKVPHVRFVCDTPNWAYDVVSKNLKAQLDPYYNIDIIYQTDDTFKQQTEEHADLWVFHHVKTAELYPKEQSVIKLAGFRSLDPFLKEDGTYNTRLGATLEGRSVVALNEGLLDIANQHSDNVAFITNGLDLTHFTNVTKRKVKQVPRRKRWTVGFVANIARAQNIHYKGYSYTVIACDEMDLRLKACSFHAALQKPYFTYDMMPSYYNKVQVLVHPSVQEGSCSAIMEALACGVPVVTTRTGYHGEVLEHMKNVIFIERSVDEIKDALNFLIENPYKYIRIGHAGMDYAKEHHDITKVAQQWKVVIDKALGLDV